MMILFRLMPSYLKDLIESVNAKARSERDVVNLFGTLLEIVTTQENRKNLDTLGLEPESLFGELPTKGCPKIAAFKRHQLKQVCR